MEQVKNVGILYICTASWSFVFLEVSCLDQDMNLMSSFFMKILRDIIDEHMEEIRQAGGIGYLVEAPADIAWNELKGNSHSGAYHGSYDFTSSSSHDKTALASRSSNCDNSCAESLGRFSSRSSDTRDSYNNSRCETHRNHYQYISEKEMGGI